SVTRQVRKWRLPLAWYAVALVGPFVLFFGAEVAIALWQRRPPAHWMVGPSFSGSGGLYFMIFGSLFAEELGWRGFGQPRLQRIIGALPASLVIGLVWSTWHLWYVICLAAFPT